MNVKDAEQLLLREILKRKSHHHIDAINRVVEREKERRIVIERLYSLARETIVQLQEKEIKMIVLGPASPTDDHIDLHLHAVCHSEFDGKDYFTLSSKLPAHKEFFDRIKFDLNLLPAIVYQELGFELK